MVHQVCAITSLAPSSIIAWGLYAHASSTLRSHGSRLSYCVLQTSLDDDPVCLRPCHPLPFSPQEPRFYDGSTRNSAVYAKRHFRREVLARLYQNGDEFRQIDEERDILHVTGVRSTTVLKGETASFKG